jgi:hypothetical protein
MLYFYENKDKQFFCGHNILTEGAFVNQLSSNAGVSVWRIVWVTTLPFHERYVIEVHRSWGWKAKRNAKSEVLAAVPMEMSVICDMKPLDYPDDKGRKLLRNGGNYIQIYTASYTQKTGIFQRKWLKFVSNSQFHISVLHHPDSAIKMLVI